MLTSPAIPTFKPSIRAVWLYRFGERRRLAACHQGTGILTEAIMVVSGTQPNRGNLKCWKWRERAKGLAAQGEKFSRTAWCRARKFLQGQRTLPGADRTAISRSREKNLGHT